MSTKWVDRPSTGKVETWKDSAAVAQKLTNMFASHEASDQHALQQEYQEYLELEYDLQQKLGIYKGTFIQGDEDFREEGSADKDSSLSFATSVSKVASDFTFLDQSNWIIR